MRRSPAPPRRTRRSSRCARASRAGAPRRSGRSGLAAMLAIGVVFREATRETAPREFVAVLQKSADSPAFAVTVDLDTRELTVRAGCGAKAPPGKAYELWLIDAKLGAPRSLGVIGGTDTRAANLSGLRSRAWSKARLMP